VTVEEVAVLVTLARWLKACAKDHVSPDEVVQALPRIDLLAADDTDAPRRPESVSLLAARLAHRDVAVRLVLTAPGQPGPWTPPRDLLARALNGGGAVVVDEPSIVLVPTTPERTHTSPEGERYLRWTFEVHNASVTVRNVTDLSTSKRQLLRLLRDTSETLNQLDIAGGRERIDDPLTLHASGVVLDPPGEVAGVSELAALALRVLAIVDAAATDPGGAVGSTSQRLRHDALRPIGQCAREALMSCVND
jgi:hypothetical protein